MPPPIFTDCPRCGEPVQSGFASRSTGLSFIGPDNFDKFAFLDEDLSGAGLTKFFPSKAAYFDCCVCRACELYLIDFSNALSRADVEALIAARAEEA